MASNYSKTSNLIAEINLESQRKKVTFPKKKDLFEKWRPTSGGNEYWEINLNISKI